MSISGGRDDTVINNRFVNNGAWGTIIVPYPDTETPPANAPACAGGTGSGSTCNYDDWGNALLHNTYTHDGYWGNPSNSDFAEITTEPGHPINCYVGNTDTSGTVTSSPSTLQTTNSNCGQTAPAPDPNPTFTAEVLCDSQFTGPGTPCPPGANYPHRTQVIMHALPAAKDLPTMPNPCAGVPANPWCTPVASKDRRKARARRISRPPRRSAGFTG
jgi:hypothetical protein